MKILHIGLCVDGKNEGLPHALKKASTQYNEMKPQPHSVLNMVKEFAQHEKWDLAFFQIQAENIIEPEVFSILRNAGTFTLNWCGDIRQGTPRWYYRTGADLTCFSNERDCLNLTNAGLNSEFLQIGIDPVVFNRHNQHRRKHDVVFMANNYGRQFPLGQERQNIASFLIGNGHAVYGNGFEGVTGNLNGNQLEESIVYNNCKIAINHSHFNEIRYSSDRLLRILGSGCFCLSHHYPGIEQDFEVGKHLDTYRDLNELRNKINFYLQNEDKRKAIADNGYNHCHNNYTYDHMVSRILELYKKYK